MSMPLSQLIELTKQMHILYVEDNEDARTFTLEMLKRFFNNITVAENGQDGLEKFKTNTFDFVLTDINMPKMNGLDMITEIRKLDACIPAIVLSAHNEANYHTEASRCGVNHYLAKPLSVNDLIQTLDMMLTDRSLSTNKASLV